MLLTILLLFHVAQDLPFEENRKLTAFERNSMEMYLIKKEQRIQADIDSKVTFAGERYILQTVIILNGT